MGEKKKRCFWKYDETDEKFTKDSWNTSCGEKFCLNEGTPKDNDIRYCCFCGKKIK
jgi:hypothetical protein